MSSSGTAPNPSDHAAAEEDSDTLLAPFGLQGPQLYFYAPGQPIRLTWLAKCSRTTPGGRTAPFFLFDGLEELL